MKNRTEVQQVFDAALDLDYGERIVLEFPNPAAADSFRTTLYKERRQWSQSFQGASVGKEQIIITRKYTTYPPQIILTKEPGILSIKVEKLDGSIKDFELKKETPVQEKLEQQLPLHNPLTEEEDKEEIVRQKALMRADGLTEEDIENYFKEEEGEKE